MRVGVDVGTSVTKAALFGSGRAPIATEVTPTPLSRPAPGRYEYDVDGFVDSVSALVARVCARAGEPVDLIAITGQGDGLWLLDDRGRAVRPAIAWCDDRATTTCDSWLASGQRQAVFERTANALFPGAGAAVLAYLDAAEPRAVDAACTATQCQHVIFERLTGVRTATRSCAMLPVFDPWMGTYDDEALAELGLTRRRSLLPDVAKDPAEVATVRPDVAEALGLTPDARVATGPYDLPAAALGAGVTEPGAGLLILGTTLACQVRHDDVDSANTPAAGLTLCTGDDNGWLRAMPAMVGTAGLDWILRLVGARHDALGRFLGESAPGANGVLALPYLSAAGERAPFVDRAARAEFAGLTLDSTPADVVRAYCEALGFAARHCFESAGLDGDVTVCGGGTASAGLTQLLADVLGRPLTVCAQGGEPAARGAVNAAAHVLDEPALAASPSLAVTPRSTACHFYDDAYSDYLTRIDAARVRWHKMPANGGPR